MKKILLLSAVLIGAATASQAGVRFSFGIPLPAPPAVVIAPSAPMYVEPPQEAYVEPPAVCAPAPVVIAPPVFEFGFGHYRRPYYRDYREYHAPYWRHERKEHEGYRHHHRR